MKNILFTAVVIALMSAARAHALTEVVQVLPMSNETGYSVAVATAVHPSSVTVSASTITQLDSNVTTKCVASLGAAYKRAEITVQNAGSVNLVVGYSASGWAATNSGYVLTPGMAWTFSLGKGIALYGLSASGNGDARVGGLCWK